jgi:hypothetical protein
VFLISGPSLSRSEIGAVDQKRVATKRIESIDLLRGSVMIFDGSQMRAAPALIGKYGFTLLET